MKKNQYGWFGSHFCVSQAAGFFIDENNRILFWPDNNNEGYIVKEAQVWDYFKTRFSIAIYADRLKKRYGWLSMVSLIGFIFCNLLQFQLTALMSLITFGICFFLYLKHFHYKNYSGLKIIQSDLIHHPNSTKILSEIVRPMADGMEMVHMGKFGRHYKDIRFYGGKDTSYEKVQRWNILDEQHYFPSIYRVFDRAILKWYSLPILALLFVGIFSLEDEIRPVASVEEVSSLYEKEVLDKIGKWNDAQYIMKWRRPILIYIDEEAGSKVSDNIKKRMDRYSKIAGIPVKYSNKRNGRVDVMINFVEGLQYDKNRNLTYLKGRFSEVKGILNRINLNVSLKSYEKLKVSNLESEKPSYDTMPIGRQLALNSLGLPVGLDFTLGIRRDKDYHRYRSSEVLLALHYHKNLLPMRSIDSAKGDIYSIAFEMTEASSFENWLTKQGRDVK